jgi:hypothetical protein
MKTLCAECSGRAKMKLTIMLLLFLLVGSAAAQSPEIFYVSDAVVGAQRLDTLSFVALGKWSNAVDAAEVNSTQIDCYKRFGLCTVSSASSMHGKAFVSVDEYDILSWDSRELLAVDTSPVCQTNNIDVDFGKRRVSISPTSKHVTNDPLCQIADKHMGTAFLLGILEMDKRETQSGKK